MGILHDRMEADLKIAGYRPSTREAYLRHGRRFAAHFMRSPAEMGVEEIRQYLLHLIEDRKLGPESVRVARSAVMFLYRVTLNRPVEVEWIPVPKKPKRIPVVLSGTEMTALLDAIHKPKYRAMMMAMYAGGLRISETCRLRPEHIDAKRMVINLCGKGNKERCTLLSKRLLAYLRDYWRITRPDNGWFFPGRTKDGHVSHKTVRGVFHLAVKAAGISKDVTPHSLRHAFATHLIELGNDVTMVKALLGHCSLRTTEVYTHTRIKQMARTISPLDVLGTPAARVLG